MLKWPTSLAASARSLAADGVGAHAAWHHPGGVRDGHRPATPRPRRSAPGLDIRGSTGRALRTVSPGARARVRPPARQVVLGRLSTAVESAAASGGVVIARGAHRPGRARRGDRTRSRRGPRGIRGRPLGAYSGHTVVKLTFLLSLVLLITAAPVAAQSSDGVIAGQLVNKTGGGAPPG